MFLGDVNRDGGVTVENRIFEKTVQLVLSFLINPIHYQVIGNKAHTVKNPVHIVYSTYQRSTIQAWSTIATARYIMSYYFLSEKLW